MFTSVRVKDGFLADSPTPLTVTFCLGSANSSVPGPPAPFIGPSSDAALVASLPGGWPAELASFQSLGTRLSQVTGPLPASSTGPCCQLSPLWTSPPAPLFLSPAAPPPAVTGDRSASVSLPARTLAGCPERPVAPATSPLVTVVPLGTF